MAAGAAAAAAIAQAIKASGAIVHVEPNDFMLVLSRNKNPLVVSAQAGILRTSYQYLTAYKGLVFFTKSPAPLLLPSEVELIAARKIWIPS